MGADAAAVLAQAWSEATDVLTVLREGNLGIATEDSLRSDEVATGRVSSAA